MNTDPPIDREDSENALLKRMAEMDENERLRMHRIHWLESRVPAAFDIPAPDRLKPFLEVPAIGLLRDLIHSWALHRSNPSGRREVPLLLGICGQPYSGKTTLAVELLRLASHNYATVRYYRLSALIRLVDTAAGSWNYVDEELLAPQMLLIDDIYRPELPSHQRIFSELVVDRCQSLKWTVLVATADLAEFGNLLGQPLAARLSANVIVFGEK